MGCGVRRDSRRIARRLAGQVAILRFIVARVILAVYAAVAHFLLPQRRNIPGLVLSGIVGIRFYNLALNDGETHVSASIPVCKVRRFEKANLK
jgi:ABC-type polysaccharide/polyol phosphate export permease